MTTFTLARIIELPADRVWALAGNFLKSPGPGVAVNVERQGDPQKNGAGAERTITIGKVCVRERLESVDPAGKSFAYRILSGAPMKDHQATAVFTPAGSSTNVQWKVEFRPKVPGIGWIVAAVTKKTINRYLDAVERAVRT